MKHELENLNQASHIKQLNHKRVFATISSRELTENILLFLLARISFMDYLVSPFGLSFFGVLFSRKKRPSYVIFSILGVLSTATPLFFFKYIGSILIILTLELIFSKELEYKKRVTASLCAVSVLLNGGIYVLTEGFFVFDTLLLIMECGLVFLLYLIFDKALLTLKTNLRRPAFEPAELMSIILLTGAVVFSISLTKNFWPLAHILSTLIILYGAIAYGYGVCVACGAVFGLALGFSTAYPAQMVCIYALSSLFSGMCGRHGRLAVSGAFAFSSLVTTLLLCPEANGILTVSYVAAACLILYFVPNRMLAIQTAAYAPRREASLAQRVKDVTSSKITETIDSIESVSTIFYEVIESFRDPKYLTNAAVFDATAETVCKNCSLCRFCWSKDRAKTVAAVEHMYSIMETKNTLGKSDIPKEFTDMCIRSDAFACELNKNYESFKVTKMWAGKVLESKRLVAEQFKNISMILRNMRSTISEKTDFLPEAEQKIAAELHRRGIMADSICVYAGDGFSVAIDKMSCDSKAECDTDIASAISDILEVPMVKEPTDCTKAVCRVTFSEKTALATDIALASAVKKNSIGSGDNAAYFSPDCGKVAIVLSDGMGSGDVANFQSSVTVELTKKLLSAGFNKETCVRLINDILMTNADRDTFSTIDLCVINLYNGQVEFVKTGSANSYIKLKGTFDTVAASSLPAGLVREISPDFYQKYVCAGDYLIMATDGITDALDTGDKNEISELCSGFSGTAQELADKILAKAIELSGGIAADDMTVAVCCILQNT